MNRMLARLAVLLLPAVLCIAAGVPAPAVAGAAANESAPVVLVVGATGRTGREVVKQLLAADYRVRALVRDQAAARELLGPEVQYVTADVRDAAALDDVARGAQFVVSALGSNSGKDPTNTPERVDYGGVKSLVDAARAAGVQQFVLTSSMGVTQPDHMLNRMRDNILQWKLKGEDYLRASGVPYTVVRPGGLTDAPGGKQGIRAEQGDKPSDGKTPPGMIPRADAAAVLVHALANPAARGKTFEVVGDAASERVDWTALFAPLTKDAP